MIILADRDITAVRECFSPLGELRLFEGRSLSAAQLRDADVLLVRSVTRVTRELLEGSRVRFVGTATAGIDHVDTAGLAAAGVAFTDAPGCNARAVAEHVISCLYLHARAEGCAARALRVGIVGHGHVGSALAALLDRLGIAWVSHDPPRAAREPGWSSTPLAEVLACDVVTLHVPLTSSGPWPTANLVDRAAIAALRPRTLLVNAARGGIVDEAALVARLLGSSPIVAAIDCWAHEPRVDRALLASTMLASCHLAGHSREARQNATRALFDALLAWRGEAPRAAPLPALRAPPEAVLHAGAGIAGLLARIHPLPAHDARLRAVLGMTDAAGAAHFDEIRRRYALRREIGAHVVACSGLAPDTVAELAALGFTLEQGASA